MWVDAYASGWDAGAGGLVNATRQGSKKRFTHKQARSVHVEVERLGWFIGVVGHEVLPDYYTSIP